MIYFKYFSEAGISKTGLTPTWSDLQTATNGTSKTGPTITEVGNGWYKYTIALGTDPWDVPGEDLIGTIDGGSTLQDADRYKPVLITKRELALNAIVQSITSEATAISDVNGRVDVGSWLGVAVVANDIPTSLEIVTSLMADTGFTAGGTTTFAELLKILGSWAGGDVRDKSGSPGVVEYLDLDDGTSVYEVDWSTTTPYKAVTVI